MATWDDETRVRFQAVGGGMLYLAACLDELIKLADDDTDLTLLERSRDWLRDRSNLFCPPGEPAQGYSNEGAAVISLDAFREWRRIQRHG